MSAIATSALYMVDTSSFTELPRTYPRPHFAGVWRMVEELVRVERLVSIDEVLRELEGQDDEIAKWAQRHRKLFLPLDNDVQKRAREILKSHPRLLDLKKKKSGADPFLISAATIRGAIVVTQEKKSGGPPALKIPDVCEAYKVKWMPLLEMLKAEGLRS